MKIFNWIVWTTLFCGAARASSTGDFLNDLETVKAKSTVLRAEIARLQAVSTDQLSKNLFWTPNVALRAGRNQTNLYSGASSNQTYSYREVSADFNLFRGFGDLYEKGATDSRHEAQEQRLKDQNIKIELNAGDVIFQALYLKGLLRTTQELVRLRSESHRIVSERYKMGRVPLQDVVKSEVDTTQQQVNLRNYQSQELENKSRWKNLFLEELTTQDWPFDASVQVSLEESRLTPEVLNLKFLSESAYSHWKSQRSNHLPSVDFTAAYQDFSSAGIDQSRYTTGLTLTIPLWNKFEISARSASAYADYESFKNQYDQSVRLLQSRRGVVRDKLEIARQNLLAAIENVRKSTKLYQEMLNAFRYGRLTMNELLFEQNRVFSSELSLNQSQLTFHEQILEACALAGKVTKDCVSAN